MKFQLFAKTPLGKFWSNVVDISPEEKKKIEKCLKERPQTIIMRNNQISFPPDVTSIIFIMRKK